MSPVEPEMAVALWLIDLSDAVWPMEIPRGILDFAEEARAARFHFAVHRNRFRRRRFAYRDILAGACGCDAGKLVFATGPQGKPFLTSPRHDVAFNASHSGDLALLAVTRDWQLGVDIELIRPEILEPSLLARVLTVGERQAVNRLPAAQRAPAFFTAWARKEAYAKALGAGLTIEVGSIDVAPTDPSPPVIRAGGTCWFLADVSLDARYGCAIATPIRNVDVTTATWSLPAHRTTT
jgi:4'-phosphopantetheinyl transferase